MTAFSVIVVFGYRYASGKWNVAEERKADYVNWTESHGKTIRRAIVIVSLIYYSGMLLQLLNL
jgi:hypothetical protein